MTAPRAKLKGGWGWTFSGSHSLTFWLYFATRMVQTIFMNGMYNITVGGTMKHFATQCGHYFKHLVMGEGVRVKSNSNFKLLVFVSYTTEQKNVKFIP